MPKKKKKVFVGMSGGVDSSVAAALLKKAGFDVTGVYMKCWTEGPSCTTQEDERSARLAASHLGIPFYVWNFIDQYKEKVVEYMLEGYKRGLTPNPDVMCNKEIKFGLFFERARELGADAVATGHYARLRREIPNSKFQIPNKFQFPKFKILKAIDSEKDQSYFLAMVKPEILGRVLFPVGKFTKTEVRAYAKKIGLPNADRKDSQGICFVGKVEIGDFLRLHIPSQKGQILSTGGEVLGQHDGSWYYTIGQRQGLGLSGGPFYVADKDLERNTLLVTKDEEEVLRDKVRVQNMNWFFPIEQDQKLAAKFRYRQEDVPVTVRKLDESTLELTPATPQRAITPGQFAVLYLGDQLVGGGVIC